MSVKPKVIIRHCESYDPEVIRGIVRDAMEEMDLRPFGRTLVKPNIVMADKLFPYAYTKPEFIDGVLGALRDRDAGEMAELAVGERCGITMPTRLVYYNAGYPPVVKKHRAKRYFFDEEAQVEIKLSHPDRLRDYLYTPEPVAKADFFVNCPKFKAHPWTTVTFSMKNYIGIQDDRHRLIDHDHKLNTKIADLQEIIQPQLIAIDGIVAGQDRMLTPVPFDMKLVILGNNQAAFDAVCCQIIGVNPAEVEHIRLVHERGYGPIDLSEIEVTGDLTVDEARRRNEGFRTGLIRVEKYFEGTKIRAYAGPPPEAEHTDYCWGGCPGAIEEAIEILRQYDDKTDERMKPMTVVFGAYKGPIDAAPDEKVVFIGDCANWKGKIGNEFVEIKSLYKECHHLDPHTAQHSDIFGKMFTVFMKLFKARKTQVIRAQGCPVSVAEQALYLVGVGKVKNPYFDFRSSSRFQFAYIIWRMKMFFRRLMGKSYQVSALTEEERGKAPHGMPSR
ncbi:MAG TPA: DUF362 domain-containing protein [Myxococcales bacterium]|nr:DUF362 domain-containing protein [Myxococcales bacterium]